MVFMLLFFSEDTNFTFDQINGLTLPVSFRIISINTNWLLIFISILQKPTKQMQY